VDHEPADLERPEPNEPRELEAARHNVRQLSNEIAVLTADRDGKEGELERLQAKLHAFELSRRWRATEPLALLCAKLRSWRSGTGR